MAEETEGIFFRPPLPVMIHLLRPIVRVNEADRVRLKLPEFGEPVTVKITDSKIGPKTGMRLPGALKKFEGILLETKKAPGIRLGYPKILRFSTKTRGLVSLEIDIKGEDGWKKAETATYDTEAEEFNDWYNSIIGVKVLPQILLTEEYARDNRLEYEEIPPKEPMKAHLIQEDFEQPVEIHSNDVWPSIPEKDKEYLIPEEGGYFRFDFWNEIEELYKKYVRGKKITLRVPRDPTKDPEDMKKDTMSYDDAKSSGVGGLEHRNKILVEWMMNYDVYVPNRPSLKPRKKLLNKIKKLQRSKKWEEADKELKELVDMDNDLYKKFDESYAEVLEVDGCRFGVKINKFVGIIKELKKSYDTVVTRGKPSETSLFKKTIKPGRAAVIVLKSTGKHKEFIIVEFMQAKVREKHYIAMANNRHCLNDEFIKEERDFIGSDEFLAVLYNDQEYDEEHKKEDYPSTIHIHGGGEYIQGNKGITKEDLQEGESFRGIAGRGCLVVVVENSILEEILRKGEPADAEMKSLLNKLDDEQIAKEVAKNAITSYWVDGKGIGHQLWTTPGKRKYIIFSGKDNLIKNVFDLKNFTKERAGTVPCRCCGTEIEESEDKCPRCKTPKRRG